MKKDKTKKKTKTQSWYRMECVKVAKKIVKIRDKNICQRCGKTGNALHCSHVYPEGKYHGMSAYQDNMKLLCYYCHFHFWHKNPIEAREWFKNKFPDRYTVLKRLSQITIKVDWEKKLEKLKKQLAKIEKGV